MIHYLEPFQIKGCLIDPCEWCSNYVIATPFQLLFSFSLSINRSLIQEKIQCRDLQDLQSGNISQGNRYQAR